MQYAVGRQLLGDVAVRRTAEADDERFDSRCEKMGLGSETRNLRACGGEAAHMLDEIDQGGHDDGDKKLTAQVSLREKASRYWDVSPTRGTNHTTVWKNVCKKHTHTTPWWR